MTRREFVSGVAATGATSLLGARPAGAADPPPETRTIRLIQIPGICIAPQYVAEELLRAEGFSEVQYTRKEGAAWLYKSLTTGEADINVAFVAPFLLQVDSGAPVVVLAGIHIGCYELFGTDRVRAIRELKGKSVAIPELGSAHHVFLSSIVAYVGLDPRRDINWVIHPPAEAKRLLAQGKVDAYLGFPPDPQELRAKKIGRVILNSAVDRPWSQYFCCFAAANREFVKANPVATKRALRALLKAANVCALEPERAARLLVDRGFTASYEYALQTMNELPYDKWREYDPEDTVRFHALRLHEAGMVKASPKKLISQGTDWRFLTELRKELKG
ncbi:MAG TPA: ABC transporter substrate-binding protein [Methylomirabilota bacterium]|nr:ABC transporter substrate-binding protein [Methylomirabilota bacterium]